MPQHCPEHALMVERHGTLEDRVIVIGANVARVSERTDKVEDRLLVIETQNASKMRLVTVYILPLIIALLPLVYQWITK